MKTSSKPASANTSASDVFASDRPVAPAAIWRRPTSTTLCVLAWGRRRTPSERARSAIRAMLRSTTSRSTRTTGVSRSWIDRMPGAYHLEVGFRFDGGAGPRGGDDGSRAAPRGAALRRAPPGARRGGAGDGGQRGVRHGRPPPSRAAGGRAVPDHPWPHQLRAYPRDERPATRRGGSAPGARPPRHVLRRVRDLRRVLVL